MRVAWILRGGAHQDLLRFGTLPKIEEGDALVGLRNRQSWIETVGFRKFLRSPFQHLLIGQGRPEIVHLCSFDLLAGRCLRHAYRRHSKESTQY